MNRAIFVGVILISRIFHPHSTSALADDPLEGMAEDMKLLEEFRAGRRLVKLLSDPDRNVANDKLAEFKNKTVVLVCFWPHPNREDIAGGEENTSLEFIDKHGKTVYPAASGGFIQRFLVKCKVLRMASATKSLVLEADAKDFEQFDSR